MAGQSRVSDRKFEQAFRAARGNFLATAELVGVTRQAVSQRVYRSEKWMNLLREIEDEEIDRFEAKVRTMGLRDSHPTMVLAYLNAKAPHRGWGRYHGRFEAKVDVEHHITPELSKFFETLAPEEVDALEGVYRKIEDQQPDAAGPAQITDQKGASRPPG